MNPEQFERLIDTLTSLARTMSAKSYTLTGAADWPILAAMGFLIVGMVGFMWNDLKAAIKDKHTDLKSDLKDEAEERKSQDDMIWEEMRRCKADCCPGRVKE